MPENFGIRNLDYIVNGTPSEDKIALNNRRKDNRVKENKEYKKNYFSNSRLKFSISP